MGLDLRDAASIFISTGSLVFQTETDFFFRVKLKRTWIGIDVGKKIYDGPSKRGLFSVQNAPHTI
jgi:hypothetical protein